MKIRGESLTNLSNFPGNPQIWETRAFPRESPSLILIDIFPHEESASKRPIPEREIISEVELQSEIGPN